MTYLITGAAGFVGFHLCKRLIIEGEKVIGIDNLNDYYDIELKKNRINYLGKFKSPDKVYFFDELPKGSSGKIQRLKIKELI